MASAALRSSGSPASPSKLQAAGAAGFAVEPPIEAGPTAASACRCEGEGLSTGIVRQANTFTILAHDAGGVRKTAGGDEFAVSILRSGVRLRVKQADNGDGSYTVTYNPEISGEYLIHVHFGGEELPGSPFTCVTSARIPLPAHCSIVGDALHRAVSREQQYVEVRFKDALSNATHAEDVDCFAEPIDDAVISSAAEDELSFPSWLRAGQPASPRTSLSPRPALDAPNAAKAKVPLVVRADVSTESLRVCQLRKGRLLYVLEEKPPAADGHVRALVAVEDEEGEEEAGWRALYGGGSSAPPSPPPYAGASSSEIDVSDEPLLSPDVTGAPPDVTDPAGGASADVPPGASPPVFSTPPAASPSAVRGLSASRWSGGTGSPSRQLAASAQPVGWVTIVKEGKALVTPQRHLAAGERQQHMAAWERRKAVDKTMSINLAKGKKVADDGVSAKKSQHVGMSTKYETPISTAAPHTVSPPLPPPRTTYSTLHTLLTAVCDVCDVCYVYCASSPRVCVRACVAVMAWCADGSSAPFGTR